MEGVGSFQLTNRGAAEVLMETERDRGREAERDSITWTEKAAPPSLARPEGGEAVQVAAARSSAFVSSTNLRDEKHPKRQMCSN